MKLSGETHQAPGGLLKGVQKPYNPKSITDHVKSLKTQGKSLRQIAKSFGPGINHGVVQRILEGQMPRTERIRKLLDLEGYVDILVQPSVKIKRGSQVGVSSQACIECNAEYISNHPRRQRCFSCSPYHGKKELR